MPNRHPGTPSYLQQHAWVASRSRRAGRQAPILERDTRPRPDQPGLPESRSHVTRARRCSRHHAPRPRGTTTTHRRPVRRPLGYEYVFAPAANEGARGWRRRAPDGRGGYGACGGERRCGPTTAGSEWGWHPYVVDKEARRRRRRRRRCLSCPRPATS